MSTATARIGTVETGGRATVSVCKCRLLPMMAAGVVVVAVAVAVAVAGEASG